MGRLSKHFLTVTDKVFFNHFRLLKEFTRKLEGSKDFLYEVGNLVIPSHISTKGRDKGSNRKVIGPEKKSGTKKKLPENQVQKKKVPSLVMKKSNKTLDKKLPSKQLPARKKRVTSFEMGKDEQQLEKKSPKKPERTK